MKALRGLEKFSGGGGGGGESDYSVCPRRLLQFLQFFQFMSVRLRHVTSGYIRLHQVTSGYVSLRRRDGTWSSTIQLDLFWFEV